MTGAAPAFLAVVADAGDTVRDGSFLVAVPIAVAAGVISFLSPCVLPLVPAYLSYVTGMSVDELSGSAERGGDAHPARRVVLGSLGFMLGVAVVFVLFGALFGGFGRLVREHQVGLNRVLGVITIALGLLLGGLLDRLPWFARERRIHHVPRAGLAGAPLLGLTFAFGWTPCIGPTLGAVLGLAASSDQASAARGALLSVAYCLGLGVPFLVTGLAFSAATRLLSAVKRHYALLMRVSGAVLVVLGVLQVSGVWAALMDQVQSRFGGTGVTF